MVSIEEFIVRCGADVSPEEVRGRSRRAPAAIAREAYWFYLKTRYGLGPRKIARLDGRCKETIYSGIKTVRNLLDTHHPVISPYRPVLEPSTPSSPLKSLKVP